MDRPQQPLSLQERADHCVELLQELKTKAETAGRLPRTNPTLELLRSVERDTNNSLRSLQAWITQYTKGTQTTNAQSIEYVSGLFSSLEQAIDTAYDALGSRLRYRRLWLVGFISHKRLGCALRAASHLTMSQEKIREAPQRRLTKYSRHDRQATPRAQSSHRFVQAGRPTEEKARRA
jgi:hypothetical protein